MTGRVLPASPQEHAHWPSRSILVCLTGALALGVAGVLAVRLPLLGVPFTEPHEYLQAHFMTIARTFAREGRLALHLVPVQNNPPLGVPSDAYIHWPPLLPLLLSFPVEWWGSSESVGRGVTLALLFANTAALYLAVSTGAGRVAGLLAALAFLTSPIIGLLGSLMIPASMAILGVLLALVAFLRAARKPYLLSHWTVLGMLAMATAVAGSWEGALVWPGLLLASALNRSRHQARLAGLFGLAACGSALVLVGWYVAHHPGSLNDLWHTVRYRTGLVGYRSSEVHLYEWANASWYVKSAATAGLPDTLRAYAVGVLGLGPPALAAMAFIAVALIRGRSRPGLADVRLTVCGLASAWVLWFLIMRNHATIHNYEMILAAPVAATSIGIALWWLADDYRSGADASQRAVAPAAILLIGAFALLTGVYHQRQQLKAWALGDPTLIQYGRNVGVLVPRSTIVFSPEFSLVPVFYSDRHMIRGIANDEILRRALPQARAAFPGHRIVLALPQVHRAEFQAAIREFPALYDDAGMVLLVVAESATR